MKNKKFFIVGSPKAGTTSLYNYLKQHPSIYLPELKELNFFSYPEVTNTYYAAKFIKSISEYKKNFKLANKLQIIGDVSPSYLNNPSAAKRIYEYDKNAKIIIILRDPIARDISHYLMDVKTGYQQNEMIEILNNPKHYPLFYREYVETGLYFKQIQRYLKVFTEKQVLILSFDDLHNNKYLFIEKICNFIEIDSQFKFNLDHKFGAYALPKNKLIGYIKDNKFINKILNKTPQNIRIILKNIFYTEKVEKPKFSNEKKILANIYDSDQFSSEEINGIKIKKWIKKYAS